LVVMFAVFDCLLALAVGAFHSFLLSSASIFSCH
jgi:hypothetical protein